MLHVVLIQLEAARTGSEIAGIDARILGAATAHPSGSVDDALVRERLAG